MSNYVQVPYRLCGDQGWPGGAVQPVRDSQPGGWQGGGAEYLPRRDSLPAYIQAGLEDVAQQPVESGGHGLDVQDRVCLWGESVDISTVAKK